jgi:HAE1 family hydrophobic/amphiphilic exporter-1
MLIATVRRVSLPLTLAALLLSAGPASVLAQTPQTPQTPTSNPTQRDATRPPGTQRNQPIPEQGRPIQQDPTLPPGTQRPAPQAPPGLSTVPQSSPTPAGQIDQPTALPSTDQPGVTQGTQTPAGQQGTREPLFTEQKARPVPPLPSLTRIGVNGDQTVSLSLNDAIRRALENNNDIEVARNDVRFAETQLRALQGIYEPVLNLTPQINKQVQSSLSILNLASGGTSSSKISTTDYTLSPSVTKFFQTGGGNYEFFFNNNRRTTNQLQSTLNPAYSSSAGVTFTQPLLRDRSIDNNRRQIRIQRKRLEQSDADFRRSTIEVISQVQRAYWDLVFALRDQQNRIANLNLARENFRRTEAQIEAGAAAPFGRAEIQTELANRESDLLLASQSVSIAENALKQLMLRDPDSKDWTSQIVPTDTPSFDAAPVNLNDALTEARKNRPELQRLRLQNEINAVDIQYFRNQNKPRIDIQSTFTKTGVAGSPKPATDTGTTNTPLIDLNNAAIDPSAFLLQQLIQRGVLPANIAIPMVTSTQSAQTSPELIGGYGRNLRNLASLGTYNLVVGVAIQIPFHNRTAQANLAGAEIQKTQLEAQSRQQEQIVEVEVRNAAQSVETSRRRVLSAREARRNAELQLAGEQRLYAVGRSTTFILFQRENELANARNQELRAETDYNKALADLQRATSTTLRANHVVVESPLIP